MKLSWKNLQYTVKVKYTRQERKNKEITDTHYSKRVLFNESGYVNCGEALFIMGASGAGKTTLLNALCDRLDTRGTANFEGEVYVNDTLKVTQNNYGKFGAYVMQDDILYETFTLEECLRFSAKLRLGLSNDALEQRVDEVLEALGLTYCRKTLVGNALIKGLSGGEKKRAAIGVEMITNPSIILLDEPTSGLDSFNAEKIVKVLVNQARSGKTVVATIHQPNSSTFKLFDRLILMMEGHTIFQGRAEDSVDYFARLGKMTHIKICDEL